MKIKTTHLKSKIDNKLAIELIGISKKYTIHHEKPTLVEHLIHGKHEEFWAVRNINLKIKKGERVGIIGPNGSGKTTLLKIIAGITTPTSGTVITNGRIVSLIDLEAGFHPDLTGLENILLNGMLLGMRKAEIIAKLNSIIDFADIGLFIDTPMFMYSQGMKLRLGFSVAIHADPDILILDENLSSGDIDFIKKSHSQIHSFFRKGKTIIVVSQWLDFIKQNCKKIVFMKTGVIKNIGATNVVNKYARGS